MADVFKFGWLNKYGESEEFGLFSEDLYIER